MTKVAWIGLGVMGYPMAGHLCRAGYEMSLYNRTKARAKSWVAEYGGNFELTPAEAVKNAQFVFACVGNDDDLRQVTTGRDGAFEALQEGAVFIDHTTASADVACELASLAEKRKAFFIDAPVSGGQAGAEKGQLTVMCGGNKKAYERASSLIGTYAKMQKLMGASGAGQLTKMVNQICIASLVQGLAEAVHFCQKAGLDVQEVVSVISKGAAQSWQMENRCETMAAGEFDFGFAVDLMRKDLAICLDQARRNNAHLPVTALVDQFYSQLQAKGAGRWDTSCLIELLENRG